MIAICAPTPLEAVAELKPLIEQHADEADRQRHLSDEVVEAMKQAGLFQLWQPSSVGGFETPLPEALPIFEAMARIDGSAGWIVAIASLQVMHHSTVPEEVTSAS